MGEVVLQQSIDPLIEILHYLNISALATGVKNQIEEYHRYAQ